MSMLIAQNLFKRYGDDAVLQGVSLQVAKGDRVGLIGPNGSGKTTLFNLLAALEPADAGVVHLLGRARVGYLKQDAHLNSQLTLEQELRLAFEHLTKLEAEMKALEPLLAQGQPMHLERFDELHHAFETGGGYSYQSRIHTVLDGLGFSEQDADMPVAHLSGGQAARAALAKLLLEEPDVLLLDEPTNHLDMSAVEWLEEFLGRWKKAYVVASHDRRLLDRLVERIWALDGGRLKVYSGNYSAYLPQREQELELQWEAYHAQQAFIQKSEDFIQRNIYDKKTTGQAQSRRRALEKLERAEKPLKEKRISFEIQCPHAGGQRVLRLQNVMLGYPASGAQGKPMPVCRVEHAILERGQRVALIGPNGAGKTTLLKTLNGQLAPLQGTVEQGHALQTAYFAQTTWDFFGRNMTLVDALTVEDGWTISQARGLLGRFLFSGDEVFKKLGELSGGQRSRVALARLSQLGGNLLLLDEPTNHLDIPARETLEGVLLRFPGSILFTSHDRYFIQQLATQVWELQGGELHVYKGDYEFYLRMKGRAASDEATAEPIAPSKAERRPTPGKLARQREREQAKQKRKEEELTQTIHQLEARIGGLERALQEASYEQNLLRIQALSAEYEQVKSELNTAFRAWEALLQEIERLPSEEANAS